MLAPSLQVNKEKVVMFMQHYLRLITKFSDLEILDACAKLDTNCFEIRWELGRLQKLESTW